MSTASAVPAIAGVILGAFGSMGEALKTANPWRGYQSSDSPNLVSFRVQHVESADCKAWIDAFAGDIRGVKIAVSKSGAAKGELDWQEAWKSWEPWTEDDLNAVKDCDDYPCDVKLNEQEAAQMKAAEKEGRMAKFQDLVGARSESYAKTGQRKEYEFKGDPVDPWAYLEKQGLKTQLARPEKAELWIRKYNLDPKKMKTLHQVIDKRVTKNATSAALWVRDAYTDHYFDGWGEWASLTCDPAGTANRGVTLVHALFLEVDLLKKSDIISMIARGKLKGAIEEQGNRYLDTAFERIKESAGKK